MVVSLDAQLILADLRAGHGLGRTIKTIVGIFATGVHGVVILRYIARREALQILIAQKIAMEHLYCIGIEMHVVAHLIERDM